MTDRRRRGARREVHAFDQRVGDRHQLARGRRHEHRAVIADADAHIGALRAEIREVLADELEFDCHGHTARRSRPCRKLASVLVRTQLVRGGVQHRVDELVAVGGAEALGESRPPR